MSAWNAIWYWAQGLSTPPAMPSAALPEFVPTPVSLVPPALSQEQFADHHVTVAEHTALQKAMFDKICRGTRLTLEEQAWIEKNSDVRFLEPEPKK